MSSSNILSNQTVAFIGCGNMAQALIEGFISGKESLEAKNLIACDISNKAREFCDQRGIGFYPDASAMLAARDVDVILLCVKPNSLGKVLPSLKDRKKSKCMLISICAGVKIQTIEDQLKESVTKPEDVHVVRVMPNVCCMVHESAMAYVMQKPDFSEHAEIVEAMMGKVGIIKNIKDEKLMDGVTGVSGSGPAFVFQFIEAMADGGVLSGLPRDVALQLAAQTVCGAAKMVLNGTNPAVLKDMVCSPAGTTIAGVHELEKGGLRGTVMNAVKKTAERSKELSKE